MKVFVARSFAACLVAASLGCGPQVDPAGADESGSSSGGDTGVSTGLVTSATLTQGPVSDTVPPGDDTANTVDTAETAPAGDTTSAVASTSGDTSGDTTDETSGDSSDDGASSVGSTEAASSTGAVDACGDGEIDPGEQCDGDRLQGFDCASLGLSGGTLGCDPITCTFDTSMCTGNGGGTSG